MLDLEVVRGGGPGWICEVALGTGHRFWLAGYNGWVSPLTFGSEAAAGAEVRRLKAALRGQFAEELAAGVTPWTISGQADLSHEGSFAVFGVDNRYLPDHDTFALIMFDAEFSNAVSFEDEADLARAAASLGVSL